MEAHNIIPIEDHRREEALHDEEHHPWPPESRETFKTQAGIIVRHWEKGDDTGEWSSLMDLPVICREWMRDGTRMDFTGYSNKQICEIAIAALIKGGDYAKGDLVEFITEWRWRGDELR